MVPFEEDQIPSGPPEDRPLDLHESGTWWRNERLPSIELFRGTYRKYEFAKHFHTVPAMGVLEAGAMGSFHEKTNHSLFTGDVLLFNPGEVHAPFPISEGGWSFRMLYLKPKLFERLSQEFGQSSIRFVRPFVTDAVLSQVLLDLHKRLEGSCDTLEVESLLLSGVERTVARYASKSVIGPARIEREKVQRMQKYIHEHYESDVSLENLATVADLSIFHLVRTFQKTVGITPHRYLTQIRVEMGKRLLQRGSEITDVAFQVGFADQSHFTRHFKRIFGVTPGQCFLHLPKGS